MEEDDRTEWLIYNAITLILTLNNKYHVFISYWKKNKKLRDSLICYLNLVGNYNPKLWM